MTRITCSWVFVFIAAVVSMSSCNSPTDFRAREPYQPPTPPDTLPATLEISGPPWLLVHSSELMGVMAKNERGQVVDVRARGLWWSSDSSVASISNDGVVYGVGLGLVTIHLNVGAITAAISLRVTARVRITVQPFVLPAPYWPMAVGDTLRFVATMIDANGVSIGQWPSVTWASSNPDAVSVNAAGVVVASQPGTHAVITATTGGDGAAMADVHVADGFSGGMATVRFAHAAFGVGPVTFLSLPGQGVPVTLSFGESVERQIPSGQLVVQTSGLPSGDQTYASFYGGAAELLRTGDHLSLYAVGDATQADLIRTWDNTPSSSVPSDSGLVRLVQGSAFPAVFLRATGAPINGPPEQCYFDPGDQSEYYRRGAGPFDIILQTKYGSEAAARIATEAQAGRAVTLVLLGNTPATAGVLAFRDP